MKRGRSKSSSSSDYTSDRIVMRAKHKEGHKVTQRSGVGTWVSKPCAVLRKDVIDRHSQSNMHKEALDREATRVNVSVMVALNTPSSERYVCRERL